MPSQLNNIKAKLIELNCAGEFSTDVIAYAKSLEDKGLPIIFSLPDLSFKIGLPFHIMEGLLANKKHHYKTFKIRKKSGGYRWISSPDELLKRVQQWIYENILKQLTHHSCAYGFVPGKSIRDNAEIHVNQEAILNLDLYRFFDSITQKRVFGVFKHLGYHPNLAYAFADILTAEMKPSYWLDVLKEDVFPEEYRIPSVQILPQGSPASPAISNYIAFKMDNKFQKLAIKTGVNYSRYADDITLSGKFKDIPSLKTIRKIIEQENFFLNESKTGFYRQSQRQEVTGIVVNDKPAIRRKYKQDLRTELFHCIAKGPDDHLKWLVANKDYQMKTNYRDHLYGKVCFVNSIEPV